MSALIVLDFYLEYNLAVCDNFVNASKRWLVFVSVGLLIVDYWIIYFFVGFNGSNFIFDFELIGIYNFLSDLIWFSVLLKEVFYLIGVNALGFDFECFKSGCYFCDFDNYYLFLSFLICLVSS